MGNEYLAVQLCIIIKQIVKVKELKNNYDTIICTNKNLFKRNNGLVFEKAKETNKSENYFRGKFSR